MHTVESLQAIISEELTEINYPNKPEFLYEPIAYILSLGGKRMRPVLTLMGCDLFGGEINECINAAIGIEVFHNFSLVHDDIMDKAPKRRGKPTVHEKWNANVGILSGDAMMVQAYQQMCKSPKGSLPEILDIFSKTALEVCEGQQYDMDFEVREDVSIPEYIKMIRLKTAVLIGGSLKIGATIAGASENDLKNIYDFGVNIGIAFQLQDDILDAYGDQDKFGKQQGGDIISNKKTYLLIKALEKLGADEIRLLSLLNAGLKDDEKVERVIALFDELEIRSDAINEMGKYHEKALVNISSINLDSERKKPLLRLVDELMVRDH